MDIARRQLLQYAVGGVAGGSWLQSARTLATQFDQRSSEELAETDTDGFDPVTHGFGFSNWEGNSGTGADGEEFDYEPGDVTQGDVREAIEESWSTAFSEAQKRIMTRIVYSWIGGNAATNGHCYGMTFSAAEYFQNPSELPSAVETASEIPRPTGAYGAVGDRIRRLQTSQLLRAEPYWFALLGLRWGLADHHESIRQLTESIDSTGTAGLALDGESNPHQVLAHGYEQRDNVTDVFIYDPAYKAEHHRDPDEIWMLSFDHESGDILEIEEGYDSFLYHNPEMDSTVIDDLIGGRDQLLDELSDAVFLSLETSGELELDVPDDVLVDRPEAEYADSARAPYNDSVLVLGDLDEFNVSVKGEDGEEYTLDVVSIRDGELVLDEAVTDVLDGVSATLQFTADEAGEYAIGAFEEVAEEAAQAAEEAESSAENANDGMDWVGDDWWLAAAAGGTGAAGVGAAYWLLSDREEES